MFTAIGVGVQRNGLSYDVRVDYFDDRVTPMKRVTTLTHSVATQAALVSAVQSQLASMKAADLLSTLNGIVTGRVLGTIN